MFKVFGIGISTGGTHTDAVIMDIENKKIITKTKSLTTHDDLSVGIINSLHKVLAISNISPKDVGMVSLATTLATNAIIEGKGVKVGLVLIGFDPTTVVGFRPEITWDLPIDSVATIKGGHSSDGVELEPLDTDEVISTVKAMKNNVDTFAVSGYFSVRSPTHEFKVKKIIEEIGKPVVCGSELTGELGIYERTVTAALNARLIPIMKNLIEETKDALRQRGIDAPLMIVKGDGSLMNEVVAIERTVETIQSGPAASVIGCMFLAGKEDAVVLDMGGTTTIIGVLKGGSPGLDEAGVTIAGWKTRVKAVDAEAWGIGGDGWIHLDQEGRITVGPRRVIPLAFAAMRFPILLKKIRRYDSTDFITVSGATRKPEGVGELSQKFLDEVQKLEPAEIRKELVDLPLKDFFISEFERRAYISRIGLTPTDLMHVKGMYTAGNIGAAKLGVKIFAKKIGLTVNELYRKVWQLIPRKIASKVLEKMMARPACDICRSFVDKIFEEGKAERLKITADLSIPIAGVGAPIHLFLPKVGSKLRTNAIVPEHHEVGAAVGALVGNVVSSFDLYVRREIRPERCIVFPGRHIFSKPSIAIDYAIKMGTEQAVKRAKRAGAIDVDVKIEREDSVIPEVGLLWSKLKVTAVGRPALKKT